MEIILKYYFPMVYTLFSDPVPAYDIPINGMQRMKKEVQKRPF